MSCGFKRQSYHGSSVVYRVRHILCCYSVSTDQACSLQNIFLKRKRNRHLYGTVATICNIYRVFLKHRSCFVFLIGMTTPDLKAAIEEKQHHLVSFLGFTPSEMMSICSFYTILLSGDVLSIRCQVFNTGTVSGQVRVYRLGFCSKCCHSARCPLCVNDPHGEVQRVHVQIKYFHSLQL